MKIKEILNWLWLPVAAVALWLVWKIFVKKEDSPNNVTVNNSGLSSEDIDLYNQVLANLSTGGNPYEITLLNFVLPSFAGIAQAENSASAIELGRLLAQVTDKRQFSKVYQKKNDKLFTVAIIDVYGNEVYKVIAQNVPDFNEFII